MFDTGNIFVYLCTSSKLKETFQLVDFKQTHGSLMPGSRFGSSLAKLGYFDGDGYMDFAVGAPFAGRNHEGAVFIYRGRKLFDFDGNLFLMQNK